MNNRTYGVPLNTISIETIRASNNQAGNLKDLVVVFVGGTSGIGSSTAKELFARTKRPRAYIIGRNVVAGEEICAQLRKFNPGGSATFLQHDIGSIHGCDVLCDDLMRRESRINCLFLTAGYMAMHGRDENDEGLDRKMCVNYYARIRCTLNLMPLLSAAADADQISRVITVLAAGSEGDVRVDDLDLRHHFTLQGCLAHCVVMTDFMVAELAARHPRTAFSHSYPGTIKTGLANGLPSAVRLAAKLLYAVMSPWILNLRESGERHFFQMTSKCYPPAKSRNVGIDVPYGLVVVAGFDGRVGSGAYLLDWDGRAAGDENILAKYREMGLGAKVWTHTMQMFEQAERRRSGGRAHPPRDSARSVGKRPAPNDINGVERPTRDPVGWRPA